MGANSNGQNSLNVDHAYTTGQAGIEAFEDLDYELEGIEEYIFDDDHPQPVGTEKLYRKWNQSWDDHAIFPESKLGAMAALGYTQNTGSAWISYVYLSSDADGDGLIDGFERAIDTCLFDSDTDNDGHSDGEEVLEYPRRDPISIVAPCDGTGCS